MDNGLLWDALKAHLGHRIVVATYGDYDDPANVCLECETCEEIILDAGMYTLYARND